MQPWTKNYLKAFGYDKSDRILCERCRSLANEIHHVTPRSHFGTNRRHERDSVDNLIALCRTCHESAHGEQSRAIKLDLLAIIERRKAGYSLKRTI